MRKLHRLSWLAILTLLFPAGAVAQQPLRWHPTVESAKREAANTNRLVLIHFWADWCSACKKMEREVLNQPQVAAAILVNYVPVKVNADFFPTTSKQYGVTVLPTDVIVTPEGQLIQKFQGMAAASQYVAGLNQVAANVKSRGMRANVQNPAGLSPGTAGPAGQTVPPRNPSGDQTAGAPRDSGDRYADYYNRRHQAQLQPPITDNPPASPSQVGTASQSTSPPPPSGNPPLGLDGYCPVQLSEKIVWALGNRAWGARHRGRTYLFTGPEQQQRFLVNPDRFAPVLSGNDLVIAIEQGQTIPGYRQHGVFFGDRVYLFANESSLDKFSKNPNHYVNHALHASRAAASPGRHLR
jgi:YHS domain-containing protein/thioredoxin-related protein